MIPADTLAVLGDAPRAFVGSRAVCRPAPTDTDEDHLVLVPDLYETGERLEDLGFDRGGSGEDGDDQETSGPFASYKRGQLNIIVTDSCEWFERFIIATTVCHRLNLLDKAERIVVFRAIREGQRASDWGPDGYVEDFLSDL